MSTCSAADYESHEKVKAEQLRRLAEVYKNDGTMLHFTSPFTLLVAVILSAQCTDKG